MFRGRFAPLSRFGLQRTGLTGTGISGISVGASRTLAGGVASSDAILCSNHPKRKNFPSRSGGTSLATELIAFDAKKSQMVSWE